MTEKDLSIEGCWIDPHSDLSYFDSGYVKIELKNETEDVIEIDKVSCSFETEEDLPSSKFSIEPMESIHAKNISSMIKIPFILDLRLHNGTNYAVIEVEYRKGKLKESNTITFDFPDSRYVIIHSLHPPEKHFFLSHKDPENTELATKLNYHLNKIGFNGYVAENDQRLGLDIWDEKIIPHIESCVALVVLWTEEAAKCSETIIREVKYAKEKGKRIMVLSEEIEMPEIFQGTKEYGKTKGKIDSNDLIQLTDNIYKNYRGGVFVS